MISRMPLVAIRCLTYNHGPYIRQCLEGFVMQKTNFPFIAIVHDDASTDNTIDIISEYAQRYPDIIKPILEKENQYSKHDGSIRRIINKAIPESVKYIAMCEGDDYWIDPYKLQKQVDFLESHSDVVYSCHRYKILNEATSDINIAKNIYFDDKRNKADNEFYFDIEYALLKEWVAKTLTCVYRKDSYDPLFLSKFKYSRDVHLVYNLLSKGKGVCHSFVGAVYRKNPRSTYGALSKILQLKTNYEVFLELYYKTGDLVVKKALYDVYLSLLFKREVPLVPKNKVEFEALLHFPHYLIKYLISRI